jgi:short-subunit dehydrogenase
MPNSARPLALVTGGSSGIGLELAKQFADHDYDVAISGQSGRVFDSADALRRLGVEAYPYQGDAATYDGVEGFWQFVADLGRPVVAAALNVGIGLGGAFVDNDLADEFRLIAINVTGTVHMAKRVVQHMVANGDGKILVVSSVSATTPTPFETVYGPSKAFGFSFAESLREELRDTGVSVTALLPGATDSDFHANAGMGRTNIGLSHKNDKTLVAGQGYEALMRGEDHVIGGDEPTRQAAIDNRNTPEAVKAARMAELLRPAD